MTKEFVCKIDMFALTQTIFCENEGSYMLPTDALYDGLTALCYDKGIYKIHFFGNEDFIDGIVSDMFADEVTRYGQNIIEIEVN